MGDTLMTDTATICSLFARFESRTIRV
jgi:hypothetical protein